MAETLSPINEYVDFDVLHRLEPEIERLMDQHTAPTRQKKSDAEQQELFPASEWNPDHLIPYDEARSYDPEKQAWPEPAVHISPEVGSALYINTITEDILPGYHHEIMGHAERVNSKAFQEWAKLWTYEESRHGRVMDGYLAATRLVNPDELEAARQSQMIKGEVPHAKTAVQLLAYTALQERATQVAHKNTARVLRQNTQHGEPDYNGAKILATVAADEQRHYYFYAGLLKKALEINPSTGIIALAHELSGFTMPGRDIPGFRRHAIRIDRSGIYGEAEFLGNVIKPVMKFIGYDKAEDSKKLTPEAELGKRVIASYIAGKESTVAKRKRAARN